MLARRLPPFKPTRIPGCAIWVEADRGITVVDAKAAGAADLSYNGRNVLQTDPAKRLAYVENALNGYPVLRGDGTEKYLTNTSLSGIGGGSGRTIFLVAKNDITTGNKMLYSFQNNYAVGQIAVAVMSVYAGSGTYGSCVFTTTTAFCRTTIYDGFQSTNATRLRMVINGSQKTLNFVGTIPATLPTTTGFTIGDLHGGGAYGMDGDFAAFVLYNRTLTVDEINTVQQHFGRKYGIAVT